MEEEWAIGSSSSLVGLKKQFSHVMLYFLYAACILSAVLQLDEKAREKFFKISYNSGGREIAFHIPRYPVPRPEVLSPDQTLPSEKAYEFPPFYGVKRDQKYHTIIVETSNQHGLDPALVKAIIMAESGYNSRAVSKRGAAGLMQLMPETAEALGVKDGFDAEQNIQAGVRYFKKLLVRFKGNIKLALAAYNAGVRKVLQYDGVPPYAATQRYIQKVIHYYRYYKEQMSRQAGEV